MKTLEKSSSNAEDLLIVAQVRLLGDTAAFGALVRKYQSPLRRYLTNLAGGDRATGDDISQETFMQAFTSLGSFRAVGSFRGWLFSIGYRKFVDHTRTHRPRSQIIPDEGVESHIRMLEQTLEPLSEVERHLVILSCIEDCSHSEIAKITELPLGTVKTTLARAKTKLKNHLGDEQL